jgi:hypothetical protein
MRSESVVAVALALSVSGILYAGEPAPHGGRPPSAGPATAPSGGTGSKSLQEGVDVGAPGNVVTAAEGAVMGGSDVDADGFVSKAEAEKNGELAKQFTRLDVNRDGKLDETEFNRFTPSKSAVSGTAPVTPADARDKKAK